MSGNQAKAAIGNMLKNDGRAEASALLRAKWTGHFDKAIRSGDGLAGIAMPPREPIIGKWFRQGELGFIYGPRGLGKTWLAMFLARKWAEGSSLGGLTEWKVQGVRRVLYVDGEMSIDGIRERDAALSVGPAPGMYYLQHEALFHLTDEVLNLARHG
ncbi:MAG TPA: AAA family ATPase [Verrucomicrobiae bacterium]|nr:AAA family ATPase [Verrucomicrobiae bacterium]